MDLIYVYLTFKESSSNVYQYSPKQIKIDVPDPALAEKYITHIEEAMYESLANLRFRKMHLQSMKRTNSIKFGMDYTLDLISPMVINDFFNNIKTEEKRELLIIISEHIENHVPIEVRVYFSPVVIDNEIIINDVLALLDSIAVELPIEIYKLSKNRQ